MHDRYGVYMASMLGCVCGGGRAGLFGQLDAEGADADDRDDENRKADELNMANTNTHT